jgi:hypothetical protein
MVAITGIPASFLPESAFLEVRSTQGEPRYFTILRDTGHTNVAQMFREQARMVPAEDRLTVLRGFVGSYPNAIFSVSEAELPAFVETVSAMHAPESYDLLFARFGVSRTSPKFWPVLDSAHQAFARDTPLESGLFDLNRLDKN